MSGTTVANQKLALDLVRMLHYALRTVRTHGFSNGVMVDAVSGLTDAINAVVSQTGDFAVYVLGDYLYVGEHRLREDGTSYRFIQMLVEEFAARGIGSLYGDERVTRDEVAEFVRVLYECPAGHERPFESIRDHLASVHSSLGVGPVRAMPSVPAEDTAQISKREQCKRTFFRAVSLTEELLHAAHLGKKLQLRHAKRIAQQMVDLMLDEEFTFLGLTTLSSPDSGADYHSVNVAIYAIALGRRLGLTNVQLSELGTGALLHDLGKVKVPAEILRQDGSHSEDEKVLLQAHPLLGAREILQSGGFSPLALKAMICCFEHDLHFDGSPGGYPLLEDYQPHVFGRLVAVVDCFDALTTRPVHRNQAMRRDSALCYMMSESGRKFDPILLRLFANLIGIYPIGTTVRLGSGRMAVVVEASDDPRLAHRPVVRPITGTSGIELDGVTHDLIDLSRPADDGRYPDEIVAALDADAIGLDVSPYFS